LRADAVGGDEQQQNRARSSYVSNRQSKGRLVPYVGWRRPVIIRGTPSKINRLS
jgi:hypothetical protein